MSVILSFSKLHTYGYGEKNLPVSQMNEKRSHIHGNLHFEINGRKLPYMGYWGENDVCFGEWIQVLRDAINAREAGQLSFTYDEGEQGQPAFQFDFDNKQVAISIVASKISDGEADPDWQYEIFDFAEFKEQFKLFQKNFLSSIEHVDKEIFARWQKLFEANRGPARW